MPLARKILICAAVDGLLIEPLSFKPPGAAGGQGRQSTSSPPIQLKYGETWINAVPRDHAAAPASAATRPPDDAKEAPSFEAFGIVGLINVSRLPFLVSITRRRQVAQVRGFPVYVVTEVAVTPCASREVAETAARRTGEQLRRRREEIGGVGGGGGRGGGGQSSGENDESSDGGGDWEKVTTATVDAVDEVDDAVVAPSSSSEGERPGSPSMSSSIAEDVIKRKGSFGRFAQSWFSRDGWRQEQWRSMGLRDSAIESTTSPRPSLDGPAGRKISLEEEAREAEAVSTLLPKLLKTTQVLFGTSRSFYFSYDVDLTRRLGQDMIFDAKRPIYSQIASMYCWNQHLLKPFSNRMGENVALPLMQGFVGQKTFTMDSSPPQSDDVGTESVEMSAFSLGKREPVSPPSEPQNENANRDGSEERPSEKEFLITLISRRSRLRAGLRYLRRGIDDEGDVANAVETEQILSSPFWDRSTKTCSFVQFRGSIPVFFTQSPYSFKPVPVLQHSPEANLAALRLHFQRLRYFYGGVQVVNLVEKGNTEALAGEAFERHVQKLNEEVHDATSKISFEWFDFHAVCRGMKFENVSLLLDKLKDTLDGFGSTVEADGKISQKQTGVVRTNCMDCLDRTNVCQSMFSRHMLESQLRGQGFDMSAQVDQNYWWFNNIWADNGDAISKQYASTAAMKGDFTRTRKRDYRGTLNDLGLSLTRYYNGIVNDYFSQAAIDFLQGNVTSRIFSEFEANMMTADPAVSAARMREQAIELCQKRVVADDNEEFTGGWVLLAPPPGAGGGSATIRAAAAVGMPLEEVVLLLTDRALYLCRFDWRLDKVASFERVDLGHVVGIRFGTFITSTLAPAHVDEATNVGLVVEYEPGKDDVQRTNTRTLSNLAGDGPPGKHGGAAAATGASSVAEALAGIFGTGGGGSKTGGRGGGGRPAAARKRIAVKAPYAQSSSVARGGGDGQGGRTQTEIQRISTICAEIERLAFGAQLVVTDGPERKSIIEKGDIVSVEEARRSTGLLEQLGHAFKRMVWA